MSSCIKCQKLLPDGAQFCCWCGKAQTSTHLPRRGNGTGSVYKLPNGKYRAIVTLGYYMADGKLKRRTISKCYAKKSDAQAAAITLKAQARPDPRETLYQLHENYLNSKDYLSLSKSQQEKLGYAWKRLEPIHFAEIAQLTVDELQNLIDKTVTTYYPARDMKVMLSHLYEIALKREIVTVNKSELIELPDAPKAKRETWSAANVQAMWSDYESGNSFTGFVLIMCYCGLRFGELATLEKANIHPEARYMIGGIKTEAGIDRTIPIAAKILPVIKRFMAYNCTKLLNIGEEAFYSRYWEMVARLDLPHYPPQTCRHYYFTQLTAAGVQAGIIAETGGHASFLTTMKNYVRIPLEDKLQAVDRIE